MLRIIIEIILFLAAMPTFFNFTFWTADTVKDLRDKPTLATISESFGKFHLKNDKTNENKIDCSNLNELWRPDENTYFEDNKIKLKNGEIAGSIFYKNKVSSFLNLELTIKSFLTTGINTNFAFKNNDGELKYAIGDGDFKTIRYLYEDNLALTSKDIKETIAK